MLTSDEIGKLAEYTTTLDLASPINRRRQRVLFRVAGLEEKHPTVDFLVEVLGSRGQVRGIFFVQVKGTMRGGAEAARLPLSMSPKAFNRLVGYPAPTYLVVVDVIRVASYIAAANLPRTKWVSSVGRNFPLGSDTTRIALYREVTRFWRTSRRALQHTRFRDV